MTSKFLFWVVLSFRSRNGCFCILQTGLVWAGFVESALEGLLIASAYVWLRLEKVGVGGGLLVAVN